MLPILARMETKLVNTYYEFLRCIAPGPRGLVENFVDSWELYPAILQEGIDAINLDEEYMAEGFLVDKSFIQTEKFNHPNLFRYDSSFLDNYQLTLFPR